MKEAYYRMGLMTDMSVSFCVPHPVAGEFLKLFVEASVRVVTCCKCLLYMSFGSTVRPGAAGSGVNRLQVVLYGF